jgi:Glycosyl transferase family 2
VTQLARAAPAAPAPAQPDPALRGWPWLRALLRRHRVFVALFVLGVVLRLLVMLAYRPALFYIDSVASYLFPLPTLDPSGQDPIGYDILFLTPILAFANLTAVVLAQHLLGLGMAVAGYALLTHKGVWRWLAALATAPVLVDAYQVQIEHNLMSDPLFEALLVAALTILAWPRRPGWWHAGLAGLLLGFAVTVRLAGLPLVLVAVLYPLLFGGRPRARLALAGLAVLGFAVPVLGYAGYFTVRAGGFGLSHVAGTAIYGRVSAFVDCDKLDVPDDERPLCPAQPPAQRPGPDYWAHDPSSPAFTVTPPAGVSQDRFLRDFSDRVIREQPVGFARAVLGDAAKALSWNRPDSSNPEAPTERWRFQTEFPTFLPLVSLDQIDQLSAQYRDGPARISVPLARVLRGYQLAVGFTPGPVLAVSALLAAAAAAGLGRARHAVARAPAGLFALSGVLVLLFADVFEFSWRYQLPGFVLLPIAGALGLAALVRHPPGAGPAFPDPADLSAVEGFTAEYGEPRFPAVVLLIAAYNEQAGIGRVLAAAPARSCGLDVATLVVVDGATDGTAAEARRHGALVCDVPVNRGQGAALRLGYYLARAGGARFIVTTDGDGQYDLAELPRLLEPLIEDRADFVTGSRRLGANESTDRVRRLGTRVFAGLVTVLTGHRVTDTSFGFRAMRAEVTGRVRLTQPQYQSSELLVGVLSQGYRVLEQPMTMRRRTAGRSKKGHNLVYGARYARVVVSTWLRERNTTRSSTANLTRNSAA